MAENESVVVRDVGEVVVEDRERPAPEPEQVLVETEQTLVSIGTELAMIRGSFPAPFSPEEFPVAIGYLNVGTVVETGANVEESEVGGRVVNTGPHAQYVAVDREESLALPDGVSDDEAVFTRIAQIAMNAARRGGIEFGETVGVYGLGLVGQLAVRTAHVAGAVPVVGLDLSTDRLDYLPDHRGVLGIDPSGDDWPARLERATDGRLADVVIEATGNPDAIPGEFVALRDHGRFVVVGAPRSTTEFDFYWNCVRPSHTIVGAYDAPATETPRTPWTHERNGELFFRYLREDRLAVTELISHRLPYAGAPELYDDLREDRTDALGVVLEW
jgi:2-desacetyl-2-hydroxyethyl bacteriochlorophyllide A dehydrogenase